MDECVIPEQVVLDKALWYKGTTFIVFGDGQAEPWQSPL